MSLNIKDYKNIYMVGIGGISMSGIALILKRWNYVVSGSDGVSSGTAFIYVPDNLVDSYKAAENWSKYANQIKPINVADTLPAIGSVAENDLYKIGEVYWKAEMVDNVLTWVEI